MKRLFDLAVASIALVAVLPLMGVIALAVRFNSSGPIFFRQQRVGRRGKDFAILKFRTRVVDAKSRGLKIFTQEDDRITGTGRFLRKWKLDQLPQLFNVLKGEMSLVGPRPEVPEYVIFYPKAMKTIVLSLRPGLTDLASIRYRNESELLLESADPQRTYVDEILPQKLKYYVAYVGQQSFWLDLKILALTALSIAMPSRVAVEEPPAPVVFSFPTEQSSKAA